MNSNSKRSHITVQIIAYIILCGMGGLIFLGLRYPLVPRDGIINGLPNTLLWWSVVLTTICVAAIVYVTRKGFQKRSEIVADIFLYFIAGLMLMSGCLIFINGVFDSSPVQIHETKIIDKRISRGRHTAYYLVVRDWRNPERLLHFDVGRARYEGLDTSSGRAVGEPITIKTSRGFLGFERFRGLGH